MSPFNNQSFLNLAVDFYEFFHIFDTHLASSLWIQVVYQLVAFAMDSLRYLGFCFNVLEIVKLAFESTSNGRAIFTLKILVRIGLKVLCISRADSACKSDNTFYQLNGVLPLEDNLFQISSKLQEK